jgi:hypothetical protein
VVLRIAIVTSVLALAARALLWSIVDVLTPFAIWPIGMATAIALGVNLVFAVVHLALRARTDGVRAATPLAVLASAGALLTVVPFDHIAIRADYAFHRGQRARALVLYGQNHLEPVWTNPHGALLKLPPDLASASRGGGEIVTCGAGTDASLLFFTYRGMLGHYSGFLYRPDGTPPPDDCEDGRYREVVREDERWFFVSH